MAEIKENNNILKDDSDDDDEEEDENITSLRDVDENAIRFMKIREDQEKVVGLDDINVFTDGDSDLHTYDMDSFVDISPPPLDIQSHMDILDSRKYIRSDTCYVIIKCHGKIDFEIKIPIPYNKTIIKKNFAACGYRHIDNKMRACLKEELLTYTLPRIVKNIDTCGYTKHRVTRYYEEYVSDYPEKKIPSMTDDVNAQVCSVMKDKTHYYNKIYTKSKYDSTQFGGIFVCFRKLNGTYWIFNLFDYKDLYQLISYFSPYITEQIHRTRKYAYLGHEQLNKPGKKYIDTIFLFKLFDILPFNTFKILDESCNVVPIIGPFEKGTPEGYQYIDPKDLNYDYSDENKTGFGKKNVNKKHKYSKKQIRSKFIKHSKKTNP